MIYRLAFIKTTDVYLKVTASTEGTPVLVAIHLNPHVLTVAARLAAIGEKDIHELSSTASKAWVDDGLDVCCDAIELDSDQIKILGFVEDWRRFA
ncbi:hypothetical protein [Tunturiibacter lichenicola]|uniref:hypothetical protein n=1 Tax=Tunturiibacter lichenicola TaxID=2051959 RepID=UPI0021B4B02B|nr:hypothetical protein [Edaphobacter lichenicola]